MRPVVLLALLLAGCAGAEAYVPYVQDITDQEALGRDWVACLAHARGWSPSLDLGAVGRQAAQGVADNAAAAAISPLVPLAGGLGAAGSELLHQHGLLGTGQRRVFLICLHDRGERSGQYHVMDPNL